MCNAYFTFILLTISCFFHFSDIFTLVSDNQGFLVRNKFEEFLREILTLPTAIYEGPSFGYNDTAARACFDGVKYLLSELFFLAILRK